MKWSEAPKMVDDRSAGNGNEEVRMSLKLGKPPMPPSEPRKDKAREMRQAIIEDADKTDGKDRDLVHR